MRILQIMSSLNQSSGILQVVLNWHRNIDKNKIQFDYLYFKGTAVTCEKEIELLGGKCYKLPYPSLLRPWIFIKAVKLFFKSHKYNTIHSHVIHLSFFFYPIAKFYGVKNIIHHSHTTKWSDKFLSGLRNRILFFFARSFITKKLSCSDLAGNFLFKKNYTVINNGINTKNFKFNQEIRNQNRKELNIENKFVVSNIGRFVIQKNYPFLINIFNEIYKIDKDSILLLAGDGPLRKQIEKQVQNLNLTKSVKFLGIRRDIINIYQIIDVLVMPSLYEGLPVVGVEAQSVGVPCFFADTISKDVLICNSTQLSLKLSAKQWAYEILKYRYFVKKDETEVLKQKGFDIKENVKQLESIYLNLKD